MSNLNRRLKKLEAVMLDDVGLVTGSPRWWAYWMEQLYKYLDRDPDAGNTKFRLKCSAPTCETLIRTGSNDYRQRC